jgi:predicted acetyltransferase
LSNECRCQTRNPSSMGRMSACTGPSTKGAGVGEFQVMASSCRSAGDASVEQRPTSRVEHVLLRAMELADVEVIEIAQAELLADDFLFVFRETDEPWVDFVARQERQRLGMGLAEDRVAATFLVAVVDGEIVGRASIRHELNDILLNVGGHIGYAVRPAFRRHGYASAILRQSLTVARDLGLAKVLLTCDDNNVGSARVIESAGGVLDDVRLGSDGIPKRRYWIGLATQDVTGATGGR